MKDQIVMSKQNGNCAVAVPLFRFSHEESLGKMEGYVLAVTNSKPLAYVLDMGESAQIFNAEFVERECEFLGDL